MGNPKGFITTDRETPGYRAPKERILDFKELPKAFLEEKVKNQSGRCMDCGVPFCMSGCPLGNMIPEFNDHVYRGQWEEAVRALYATNNFPEVTGRICPAPCESSCVLGITDPPVTIKQMEKAIASKAINWGIESLAPKAEQTGKKVAIVGSGPAGLACAQQLVRAGHSVMVYEKAPEAGGLLTWGIPAYKLPKEIVKKRVDLLICEGIGFTFNTTVGKDISWEKLREDYDALVICIGSEIPRNLDVPGREGEGVHFAMDFLHQQSARLMGLPRWNYHADISAEGKDVIVIGGGDTGADCIGTSLRQGAKSVVNFELMPKPPADRSASNPWPQYNRSYNPSTSAEENHTLGGTTEYAIATQSIQRDSQGNLTAVETVRVKWEAPQPGDRPQMTVVPNSKETWPAQLVLLAMGYLGPKADDLKSSLGVDLSPKGNIVAQEKDGVFAAGDCRRGQSLVVWAIAEGREMAARVDTYLMNKETSLSRCRLEPYQY